MFYKALWTGSGRERRQSRAIKMLLGGCLAWFCLTGTAPGTRAAEAQAGAGSPKSVPSASQIISRLLRHPQRLELVGSGISKETFYFRLCAKQKTGQHNMNLLVASNAGHTAVVSCTDTGLPYAYFGDGIFVIADTQHPGRLDVLLGASPVLLVGAQAAKSGSSPRWAFRLTSIAGTQGAAGLNLSVGLSNLPKGASQATFSPSQRKLIFLHGTHTDTVVLAPPGAPFPVQSVTFAHPRLWVSIYDITADRQPVRDLFGVTPARVKATDLPIKVWKYRPGLALRWYPCANFGSRPGDLLAAHALEQLMPINADRDHREWSHVLERLLAMLKKSTPSDSGPHSGLKVMQRLFALLEWRIHDNVDLEANQGVRHLSRASALYPLGHYTSWKFNRAAYHKTLEKQWGSGRVRQLTRALMDIALRKDGGPIQKFLAIDLLSDIGPDAQDLAWANGPAMLSKAFSGPYQHARTGESLLFGLFRARWGLTVDPQKITTAKNILANKAISLPLRLRALEILCFENQLPDDPAEVVSVVKPSLDSPPGLGWVATGSGRYLFDLSLCKTGRKILLQELEDVHSPLAGHWQLTNAAFNDVYPGTPGYMLAVRAAMHIAGDDRYDATLRNAAFWAAAKAPMPLFAEFIAGYLKPDAANLPRNLMAVSGRMASGKLMPQLVALFRAGNARVREEVMNHAIGCGFPKGGDAQAAAPIIKMALADPSAKVQWAGMGSVESLHAWPCKLDDSQFYPALLDILKHDLAETKYGAVALHCFQLATGGRWRVPVAGMTKDGHYTSVWEASGRAWWREHYAAVRASALEWAARHKVR